jgi:DNA-directed RNA polymerase specialized sigma24 family protein
MEDKQQKPKAATSTHSEEIFTLLNDLKNKLLPESIITRQAWLENSKYLSDASKQVLSNFLKFVYENIIWPMVLSLMGGQFSGDDCKEVAQQAWIRLYCHEIPKLLNMPNPVGWIYKIVYYVFIDFYRKLKPTLPIDKLIGVVCKSPQWQKDVLPALEAECERSSTEKYPKDKNRRDCKAKCYKVVVRLLYKKYKYKKIGEALRRLGLVKKGSIGTVKKYVRELKKDPLLKKIIQEFIDLFAEPLIEPSDLAVAETPAISKPVYSDQLEEI